VSLSISDPDSRTAAKTSAINYTCTVFSVEWLDIRAEQVDLDANVSWKVAQQIEVQQYEVQRSVNGNDFHSIATQNPQGTTNEVVTYQYADKNAFAISPTLYYRIKETDISGATSYSKVVEISKPDFSSNWIASVYPNPIAAGQILTVSFSNCPDSDIQLTLYNELGMNILEKKVALYNGKFSIDVPLSSEQLQTGIYLLHLTDKRGKRVCLKITVE
jgi:hypothetical protein